MTGKHRAWPEASQPGHDDQAAEELLLLKEMLRGIQAAIWIRDIAEQRLLYVSPGFEWIWGMPVRWLLATARTWIQSIHPEDRDRVLSAVEAAKAGPHRMEYRIVRPDGLVRHIRDRSFPIQDAARKVYRLAGISEEMTGPMGSP